jgi:hypothetical protein
MYANTALYLYRTNKENKKASAELKAHRMAGYFMGLSIVGHVAATRLAPLYILHDDDASVYNYGFVHAAAHHLGGAPFYLYLIIFAMAGGWHLIYGTRSALATLLGTSGVANNKPMPIVLKVMALTNHVFIILGVLTLSGWFYTIHISQEQMVKQDKLFTTMGLAA